MKLAWYYFIYANVLFNCYVWLTWPELFYAVVWQWDIFITLLFAPIIYLSFKDERTN